jgi:hypothetical protein
MDTKRIRMSDPYGQTPANVYNDFDWVRRHEKQLLEKYGECSILVYNQQVIGIGRTYQAAIENAEQNLPPHILEVTPIHERLRHRFPFSTIF